MIGAVSTLAGDRAWRIGAYALATLIHVPLIVAVQQFGEAIAAARPAESVITLLDTPETARLRIVEAGNGRADAVTQTADTLRAASSSATRLEGPVTTTALTPTPSSSETAALGDESLSIASVIASETLSPSPVTDAAPAASSIETTAAAETVGAAPSSPLVPPPAATRAVTAQTTERIASVSVAASPTTAPSIAIASATSASSTVGASSTQPASGASTATAPSTASPVTATRSVPSGAVAPATPTAVAPGVVAASQATVAATTPSAVSGAQILPRIAIPAAGTRTSSQTAATASPPVASSRLPSGENTGFALSPTVTASAARVTTAVPSVGTATRTAGTVVTPSVPAARTLPGVAPLRPAPIRPTAIEPAPRIAALPTDTSTAGPEREALNAFVRGYGGGGCFAALTIASSDADLGVAGFSRDETELTGFEAALGKRTGPRPTAAARRVSEAQCAALAFARSQAAYPDFPVRLTLRPDTIASGGTIAGQIAGVGDRPLTMLILDDEGRIQDASFLLSREPNGDWTFETPLSLTGDPVPTVQLFVALAGQGPISTMRPPVPVEARRYFAEIDRLLKARSQTLDVALAAFTVGTAASTGTP